MNTKIKLLALACAGMMAQGLVAAESATTTTSSHGGGGGGAWSSSRTSYAGGRNGGRSGSHKSSSTLSSASTSSDPIPHVPTDVINQMKDVFLATAPQSVKSSTHDEDFEKKKRDESLRVMTSFWNKLLDQPSGKCLAGEQSASSSEVTSTRPKTALMPTDEASMKYAWWVRLAGYAGLGTSFVLNKSQSRKAAVAAPVVAATSLYATTNSYQIGQAIAKALDKHKPESENKRGQSGRSHSSAYSSSSSSTSAAGASSLNRYQ